MAFPELIPLEDMELIDIIVGNREIRGNDERGGWVGRKEGRE